MATSAMVAMLLAWLTLLAVAAGFQPMARMRRSSTRTSTATATATTTRTTGTRTHAAPNDDDGASSSAQAPWVYDTSPKSAKEKASFRNQVPFSEDIYETLKGTIELLTKRLAMKKDVDVSKLSIDERAAMAMKSLSVDEAQWLKSAIEVIIDDAYRYGPPPRPVKSADPDAPEEQA